ATGPNLSNYLAINLALRQKTVPVPVTVTLTFNKSTIAFGEQGAAGNVGVTPPALEDRTATISFSSNAATTATPSVDIPARQLAGTFSVPANQVATSTQVSVTASVGPEQSASAGLTVNPPPPGTLDIQNVEENPGEGTGTISFRAPAIADGSVTIDASGA